MSSSNQLQINKDLLDSHLNGTLADIEDALAENSKRSYKPAEKSWEKWCLEKRKFADGEIVNEKKILAWLREEILPKKIKPRAARCRAVAAEEDPGLEEDMNRLGISARNDPELPAMLEELKIPETEAQSMILDDQVDLEGADAAKPVDLIEEEENGKDYAYNTLRTYVNAIVHKYTYQVTMEINKYPHPRGTALKGLLKTYNRKTDQKNRDNFADRGADGITSGYSDEEFERLHHCLLTESGTNPSALRTRLDILLGHFMLLRGENRRAAELSDLSPLVLPKSEGPSECNAVVLTISNGKTNRFGRKQFMGAIRNRNPLLCVLNALAMYFFWRWHISGEQAPSFSSRKSWYRTKVLVADKKDVTAPISYTTQYKACVWAFRLANIITIMITHVMRACGARAAERHGVSYGDISRGGRWDTSNMTNAYLTALPMKMLRKLAGFAVKEGSYFLPRSNIEPPESIARLIFPFVEQWELRFRARAAGKKSKDGGLDQDDTAGQAFIALLLKLRVILLQDLALLQPTYPSLPHFKQPFAEHPDWEPFAQAVRFSHDQVDVSRSQHLTAWAPELSDVLYSCHEGMRNQASSNHSIILNALKPIAEGIDFLRMQFPITVTFGRAPVPPNYPNIDPRLTSQPQSQPQPSPQVARSVPLNQSPVVLPANSLNLPPSQPLPTMTPAAQSVVVGHTMAPLPVEEQEVMPVYIMQDVNTVTDLWREWKVGIHGGYAMEKLDARWGAKWRNVEPNPSRFCRRKAIYDEINRLIDAGMPPGLAVDRVEKQRAGRSLYKLSTELAKARAARKKAN